MIETKNALINDTLLGYEDHGIFTFILHLDYGGSGQGAGMYTLDSYDKVLKRRVGKGYSLDLIMQILNIVGVRSWEELKGKHIRVRADFGKVYAIGNLLKEEWLVFEDFFAPYRKESEV